MKRATVLLAVLVAIAICSIWVAAPGPAQAADFISGRPAIRSAPAAMLRSAGLPFPRSRRAQAVWASDACWSDCQSYCTWEEAFCLKVDAQGRCLKFTDRCDRVCQNGCRIRGGPLVGFVD